MVYPGEVKLSPQQMRAAIEVLPFEGSKLATVGVAHLTGQDFAALLDRGVSLPFCIPEGTNASDLTEIVAKFLDENPAKRNHSGADLVGNAWIKSFPCQSH
jgi:Rap1a immunity proteins